MESKNIKKIVDKSFRGSKTAVLSSLIEDIPKGETEIPTGTLVLVPAMQGNLIFRRLDKPKLAKYGFIPFVVSAKGKELGITEEYLQWFFTHESLSEYWNDVAIGGVLRRIPRKVLLNTTVPIPRNKITGSIKSEINVTSPFRDYVKTFYEQYRTNLKHEQYRTNLKHEQYSTCAILAGVISEAILYQLLLENDVKRSLLDKDNGLGLGKLVTYVELLQLDKSLELNLQHFKAINKLRNSSVHFGKVLRDKEVKTVTKADLTVFDEVVKQFGI
ncbi:hypothetical protein I9F74_004661 [Vibrio parahaemolyticus]|uniref:hypothetical protein n=1 Tax=Vibrio parahaemolyticus TaxID=670 RepID=UPI001124506C|nr:hypothetical protein [Vibrio parahaemolyticus]EGS6501264.1 hypothetical protein [Vibrio parahaemolyticus]TOE02877.1 hypothetical protein CGJ50_23905 [Vibrio parahaemolyticus]